MSTKHSRPLGLSQISWYQERAKSRALFLPLFIVTLFFVSNSLPSVHIQNSLVKAPKYNSITSPNLHLPNPDVIAFQKCSIKTFLDTGLLFLKGAAPIPVEEFVERRDRLAEALWADGVDAFAVEAGYTFSYYANVTQPDWEVWEVSLPLLWRSGTEKDAGGFKRDSEVEFINTGKLTNTKPEERPMLMIIQPLHNVSTGITTANTTFLCPSFEESRLRLLEMPFPEDLQVIPWEEHWNPYMTLFNSGIWNVSSSPTVMVDEEMRDFIQRGFGENGFHVVGLAGEVEKVRQTKSEKEIGILRAVNTGTVEAVKAMRECESSGGSDDGWEDGF